MTAFPRRAQRAVFGLVVCIATIGLTAADPRLSPPPNTFTVADDAELGRDAAVVIRKRLPILTDADVGPYVTDMLRQLVDALPEAVRRPEFDYHLFVLNIDEPTSLALPGGPLFISRTMLEAVDSDDALAGLIANEVAHIALRHATAQASRGERYQIGAIDGRHLAAAALAESKGILERGGHFAVWSYFLTYALEYERQADVLAAYLMTRAGYNPKARAAMFDAAKRRGARQWVTAHPRPRERADEDERTEAERDVPEASTAPATRPSERLTALKARLAARSTAAQKEASSPFDVDLPIGTVGRTVMVPSGESRSATAGDLLLVSIPLNWERRLSGNATIFAPSGAFIDVRDGPVALTHGIEIGIARSLTGDLKGDTLALLQALGQDNPRLTWTPLYRDILLAGRDGLTTTLSHVSPVIGDFEFVSVSTAHLSDDSLLYVIGIAPQNDASTYRKAFTRVLESLQILE